MEGRLGKLVENLTSRECWMRGRCMSDELADRITLHE